MKLERAHPEINTMWDTLKNVPVISPIRAKQPEAITRKLKSFQLEGLDWMMQQEKSQWKGGLLGDEMGMGKTIQAVSLIMSDYPANEPTLVVVPPVALMQWQSEIKEYTDGKLKVLIHHNSNPKVKTLKRKDLRGYDVIMISYAGLESMYRKESKGWKRDDGILKEDSVIHSIKFHRLILDEAHSIKARTTGVAKACFALKADYKWCLSGTPVQNRIGEFFSLLRFLEVRPFACYFCKVCKCAELHWSQSADMKCTHCHHRGFDHVSIFNQELLTPITQGETPEIRREALDKLRLITDRIMLRRLKRDYTASMELPPKEVIIHQEFFGEIERDFSSSIMTNTHRQFDTYVSRGVMLNNYANIFGLIMQMRQVANHPDLILKKHAEGGQNVLICSICDEPAEEAIRSRCHHEFCRKCAKDYVRSFGDSTNGEPDCPRCHIPLSIDFDQPDIEQDQEHVKKNSIINRIKMEDWTSSTKIEMLVYDLYKLRSQKRTHKSIVFSQFTSMLQLVEWRLRRAGFNTVMLDGSMSPSQRQKSIEYFMNNTDVEVFLVSLKAGGVALNLTEASRVFIIDPWWNPSVEWQSADRYVYRPPLPSNFPLLLSFPYLPHSF
jgi:DNA repair protein RAD16